ncbi:MAG: sulfatase-like hydrolase/transferase [Thermomicrobiales bacterium]
MSERPNILLMIADDHRADALGAAAEPVVLTPTLDELAANGANIRQAHIMGGFVDAVCVPSRATLLTGTNPFRASSSTRVGDSQGAQTLNPELAVLPAILRKAGYHTHAIGKWHNDKASFTTSFDNGTNLFFGGMIDHWQMPIYDFDPEGVYPPEARHAGDRFSSELHADAAISFLREYRGRDPFFLYLAFAAPHDPRTAPKAYADLYIPDAIPLPPNFLPRHPFDNGNMRVRDELLAPWPRTTEVVRQHIADYYAMITHLDAQIGRVLAALAASEQADNTVVIYTADHGLAVGQHGLMGKQNLYAHSVRVPLLMRGPGVPTGKRLHALASLADLFPTLCDLTGTPTPASVEGRSLVPVMTGKLAGVHERVHAVHRDVQRMVHDGRWKLIRYYRSKEYGVGTDHLQLFDLAEDPWETRDMAADPAQASCLHRLAGDLAAWQQQVGDPLGEGVRSCP